MKHKIIRHGESARESAARGVSKLARVCSVTLGPSGRNVLIDLNGKSIVTKDGVTVANEIDLQDKFENLGARVVIESARETLQRSGDGTTTTIVLADAFLREFNKYIASGIPLPDLLDGADTAIEEVLVELESRRVVLTSRSEIAPVALCAANGDENIASIVLDAIEVVGDEGTVSVRRTLDSELIQLELVGGMTIDRGMVTKAFANHGSEHIAVNPLILLYDRRIEKFEELEEAMNIAFTHKTPLVVIAHSYKDEVVAGMMANYAHHIVQCVAVTAPFSSHKSKAILRDIAALTGATVISEELGLKLSSVRRAHLGRCAMITCGELTTTIAGGCGDKNEIRRRIKSIQEQIESCSVQFDRDTLQERLSKLIGAMATINVGGVNDTSIDERKYLVDDCLFSTRSAAQHGVVSGGGSALFHSASAVSFDSENVSRRCGQRSVVEAVTSPLKTICRNMSIRESTIDAISDFGGNFGPSPSGPVDMYEIGVLDSYKTVRTALVNAYSTARTLALVEASVAIEGFARVEQGD